MTASFQEVMINGETDSPLPCYHFHPLVHWQSERTFSSWNFLHATKALHQLDAKIPKP